MAITKGQEIMLFVDGVSIAYSTNHTLEINGETQDCSTKDNGGGEWASSEMGLLSWSVSSENFIALDGSAEGKTYADLFKLMVKKEAIKVVFGPRSKTFGKGVAYDVAEDSKGGWTPNTDGVYEGQAYITSLSLNAPNGDNSSFSLSLTGTGALKEVEKKS